MVEFNILLSSEAEAPLSPTTGAEERLISRPFSEQSPLLFGNAHCIPVLSSFLTSRCRQLLLGGERHLASQKPHQFVVCLFRPSNLAAPHWAKHYPLLCPPSFALHTHPGWVLTSGVVRSRKGSEDPRSGQCWGRRIQRDFSWVSTAASDNEISVSDHQFSS